MLILVAAGAQAQTQTLVASLSQKSTKELLADLTDLDKGNDKAKAAVRAAGETRNLEVLAAGLKSSNYDVRGETLDQLRKFSPREKRAALLPALRDDTIWSERNGGEAHTVQVLFFKDIVAMLKTLGLDVAWQDFYSADGRKKIVKNLLALNLSS